jgi:hypothetical protein
MGVIRQQERNIETEMRQLERQAVEAQREAGHTDHLEG